VTRRGSLIEKPDLSAGLGCRRSSAGKLRLAGQALGHPLTQAVLTCLAGGEPRDVFALRFPEDLVDAFDVGHQFFGVLDRDLLFDGGAELGGLPEEVVQLGIFLEVRRFEIVGPEH
jgi:hypothetical protein